MGLFIPLYFNGLAQYSILSRTHLKPLRPKEAQIGDGNMTDKLLTIDELADALGGLGRASIYRHIKALHGFPQPVKVGAATRFRQSEVQAYIRGDHSQDGQR
jgi:predicted DNA-binding transcriptional regulator AlpA